MWKMNDLFCSIIVPVYNVEEYIEECIDSILTQTYENFELLLVDDGSSDSSGLICEKYAKKDKRIRVFHKENGGLSSARNFGLENIKGDCVAFVDSDDYIHKEYLERLTTVMQETDADLVCCDMNKGEKADWKENKKEICIRENEDILKKMYIDDGKITVAWNKLYAKHFFVEDNLRFAEGMLFEDMLIMPYILRQAKRMVIISDNLYFYRKRKGSITKSGAFSEKRLDIITVVEKRMEQFKEWGEETLFYIELEGYIRKLIRYRSKMDKYCFTEETVIINIERKLKEVLIQYICDLRLPLKIKVKAISSVLGNKIKTIVRNAK